MGSGATFEDGLNNFMPLHPVSLQFAPARKMSNAPTLVIGQSASALRFAQAMAGRAAQQVSNDNGQLAAVHSSDERMLRAALRHFAEHGLGAAKAARIEAEKAFFSNDRAAYDWWLGITRTLDQRLARDADMVLPETAQT